MHRQFPPRPKSNAYPGFQNWTGFPPQVSLQPARQPIHNLPTDQFVAARCIKLSIAARELIDSESRPMEFVDSLLEAELLADARHVLAQALPPRRALWWAAMAAAGIDFKKASGNSRRSEQTAEAKATVAEKLLGDVVAYTISPDERLRYQIGKASKECGFNSLAGCLGSAAFCTGASIAPAGLPEVRPKRFVVGRLVSTVVYLAAVLEQPEHYRQALYSFLVVGRQLAIGPPPWEVQAATADATIGGTQ